ncbi:MAG: GMC oxidoreductase [bacterium]
MNFVIGSGPAGVSAAAALLKRGLPVTLLDAGERLEHDRRTAVDRLKTQTPDKWDARFINEIRESTRISISGIGVKLAYGSDYANRGVNEHILHESQDFSTLCSLAQGGLSAVWGGAVLPWTAKDFTAWPFGLDEMAPHYKEAVSMIPLAGCRDDFQQDYPLYADKPALMDLSGQAGAFQAELEKNREKLRSRGLTFGRSRLAVSVNPGEECPGCVYCGLCLYGCPYDLIYNTEHTLAELIKAPGFRYCPGVLVDKVAEKGAEVEIYGRSYPYGTPCSFRGARVFLACGVLSTARIMLNSLEKPAAELSVQYNQHFLLPLLRFKASPHPSREALHTMAQIFIKYSDPASARGDINFQVYSFNDFYARAMSSLLGSLYRILRPAVERFFLSRLLILQGYLHSKASPVLKISLDASTRKIRVRPEPDDRARDRARFAARMFLRNAGCFGAVPVLPFLKLSAPGIGAHIGGSFPMRQNPGPFETDTLGRPHGFRNVHLADASVFPDIPPTTVTLTIMANAHRIASGVPA